jgi:hypothetical protein
MLCRVKIPDFELHISTLRANKHEVPLPGPPKKTKKSKFGPPGQGVPKTPENPRNRAKRGFWGGPAGGSPGLGGSPEKNPGRLLSSSN